MANLSTIATAGRDFQDGGYKINYGVYSPTVTAVSGVVNANLGNSFRDVRTGNRAIAIHNLKDGQSVTILVQGAATNVITITAYSDNGITTIPVKYGAGQSGVMASTYSLFTVYRVGGSLNFAVIGPIHGIV
jgi:hypothetical protein